MVTEQKRLILREPDDDENPFGHTIKTLSKIINHAKRNTKNTDLIGLTFANENDLSMEVNIEIRPVSELTVGTVLDEINRIAQSNKAFSSKGIMHITSTKVIMPEGKGGPIGSNRKLWEKNKCLITPKNNNGYHRSVPPELRLYHKSGYDKTANLNNFCGVYAAEIGMKHRISETLKTVQSKKSYEEARRQQSKAFAQRIDQIMDECNINLSDRGMIPEDWLKLQNRYKDFRFIVYEDTNEKKLIFNGSPSHPLYGTVHICLIKGHYSYCTTNKSLFNFKYQCEICNVRYTSINSHSCVKPCYRCAHTNCGSGLKQSTIVGCNKCKGLFKTLQCYDNHTEKTPKTKKSKCDLYKKCLKCGHMHLRDIEHKCGWNTCLNCKNYKPAGHKCFIQKSKLQKRFLKAKINRTLITVYDTEATQCRQESNGRYMHEINVICSRTLCNLCWNYKEGAPLCKNCGERDKTWTKFGRPDANVANEFLTWAQLKARGGINGTKLLKNRIHILIAHYAQGYDSQFIVAEGLASDDWNFTTMIHRGRKILYAKLKCEDVTVVLMDFYCYVAKSLSSICKSFDLDPDLAKGSFPHLFNEPANWNYSSAAMPPKSNWAPDAMNVAARDKFLKWWTESDQELKTSGKEWNFQHEITNYCMMDVRILAQALVKFCNESKQLGIEPLHQNFTLATLCLQVYTEKFMPENTIGIFFFFFLNSKLNYKRYHFRNYPQERL